MKKALFALVLLFDLLLTSNGFTQVTYTMVASASQLEAGAQYILVGFDENSQAYAMGYQKTNNRHAITIDNNGGIITATVATDPSQQDAPFEFTLGGSTGAWTIFDPLNNGYLYAPGGGNYLRTQSTLDDSGRWTITDGNAGGMIPVSNGGIVQCCMHYNITSTLFSCYKESSNVSAPIYFFKAGGSVQPSPEPTNYPTNFTATVNGLNITLTWNDATGGQLPHKYLIIGSVGSISVPIDGIPVPDGALAKNVNYGVQTVTFSGLNSNTTYHFAIFPYTNSGADINYKNVGNYPTANATTENITVLLFENFNDNLGTFTAYDALGDQSWHQASYQGITYANMNGYAGGTANPNEDWLISPAINKTGFADVFVEFRTAKKFEGPDLQVLVSTNYNGVGTPSNFTWVDLTNEFVFSTGNYEWVESGRVRVEIEPNVFYVAFVYTSNAMEAPSWEIDCVNIEASDNSLNYYTITAVANPTNGGTVSGVGTYAQGSTCTLQATPNSGYSFVKWTKNGTQVSTNPNYSFTVTGDASYVAHFQQSTTTYTITATASPSNAGTITGAGSYASGSTCTLWATPNSGYEFVNWLENGATVSTNATYSFTVTGNRNLVAVFDVATTYYDITATANPINGGTVTGGGTYAQGSTCTLRATANSGYFFVNWTKNGTAVSTNPNYSFTVTDNASYVANFEPVPEEYTITVNADPANGGTVSGGGTYPEGSTCVISAMPNTGYVFENWTINGSEVSTDPTYSFIVSRDAIYVAHFTQSTNHVTITAMAEPVEGGAVSGGGTYELGDNCTLYAIAASGYEFVNWTLNGSIVSTEASFSFPVTSNAVYVAHFNRIVNHYTVTVSLEPTSAGSVIGAGSYEEGTSCTLIAIANPTYTFVSWTENGAVVSTDDHYTFTVERNRNFVAVFSQGQFYTISASAGANGTISPEGDVFVEPGEDKTFAIIPNSGCQVRTVLVDGIDLGPIPSYTFRSVNGNHSIHAEFSGLGVDDQVNLDLKIYPNPANDKIHIESPNMKKISIFNLMGVQIENKEVNDDYTFVNTNEYSQGTYILKVEKNDGRIGYSRFVIVK